MSVKSYPGHEAILCADSLRIQGNQCLVQRNFEMTDNSGLQFPKSFLNLAPPKRKGELAPHDSYRCTIAIGRLERVGLNYSKKGELAQLARALHWQCRGHRFESGILHPRPASMRAFFISPFEDPRFFSDNWSRQD